LFKDLVQGFSELMLRTDLIRLAVERELERREAEGKGKSKKPRA
jgi:hypothetical protein